MEDPEYYKSQKHFRRNKDIEDIYKHWDELIAESEIDELDAVVRTLAADPPTTGKELEAALMRERKRHHCSFRKAQLLHAYMRLVAKDEILPNPVLQQLLVKKSSKSQSGVLVITVLTSPYPRFGNKVQKFSCQWNCYYCPSEPDQPKSYLHDEPAVKRANENNFDPVLQLTDRAATLAQNGHPVDKIELLVLGGTWASYPHEYQEEFCRDLFYAANTFWDVMPPRPKHKRERLSLREEQLINETAKCKIIGLTLETRPDTINAAELRRLRSYGCTRLQLGLQHTDDQVLGKINRGCTTSDAAIALRRLKDACYKVDVHLMPNLPGSSLALDQAMFERMLGDPELQADQWKIYPTQVVPWTIIKKWYESGEYRPYPTEQMFQLLMHVKARVHPWIRLNRVVRDIPIQYVSGGLDVPNLREDLLGEMAELGLKCRCIRCREVGGNTTEAKSPTLVCREYAASRGAEYFLSMESDDRALILGFCRLRLPSRKPTAVHVQRAAHEAALAAAAAEPAHGVVSVQTAAAAAAAAAAVDASSLAERDHAQRRADAPAVEGRAAGDGRKLEATVLAVRAAELAAAEEEEGGTSPFPELDCAALIRELHVYGQLISTHDKTGVDAQHSGHGRRLMNEAERISRAHGYRRVAVIAGVGSRGYYRKLGYDLDEGEGQFMIKELPFFATGWRAAHDATLRALAAIGAVLAILLSLLLVCVPTASRPEWACHASLLLR